MDPATLRAVPGVPESVLSDELVASLPRSAPDAPWECACDAIVWVARGVGATARSIVPAELAGRAPLVVGGLVAYRDTPVGPYREVFGVVGLARGRQVQGSVPFMAVDSRDSLVGGRQNWSLPKSLARFTGSPVAGVMSASGDGWTVRVSARAAGPALPVRTAGRIAQRWPDGAVRSAVMRGRGHARLALVRVSVESDGLAAWLRPGRHVGAIVTDATFTLPAATEKGRPSAG
jgi:Acetoacetate decarboxylase (ADC).